MMNDDLKRLISLQALDSAAAEANRRVADEPERQKAFDARLDAARQHVATAREQLAANKAARAALEKDVAVHQSRLSKFRDQLMAVKTNVEFAAVNKEILFAQGEIKAIEDKVLDRMLEGDEMTAGVKRAEADLAAEEKAVEADRRAMTADLDVLRASLTGIASQRADIIAGLDEAVLLTFAQVARKRNGIAVAEAREGICTICHVRLRPQVFNSVRRNDSILQCDHCNRILYFVPAPAAAAGAPDGVGQPAQ
jgi:predicted  nucleic acid-binding Zn-ribbon protein